jgi:hypothetical protein
MSYIINNSDGYVNTKLTEVGRQKLAKGTLNFSFWAIGDSEINYDREAIVDANLTDATLSATTRLLRPKDRQPNFKSYVTTGGTNPFMAMTSANIKTLKVVVNNEATERGFFSGDSINGWVTLTGSPYTISTGTITDAELTGGTTLMIGTASTRNIGDLVLIKMSNQTLGGIGLNTNSEPVPHLWYKVQATSGATITVDRNLPNLGGTGATQIQFMVYAGGEVYNTIGSASTVSYWDSGTLSFDSACDISCADVPVWNMNNVWCEDLAGITGTSYEGHTYFGSYPYLGEKDPYFEYSCASQDIINDIKCEGLSQLDDANKSIAIIHYTNNAISNFYGEFFYINNDNNKTVKLHIPDLMYHRRGFTGGTASGDSMGMTFMASGDTQLVGTSDLEFVDLIEDPDFLLSGTTPLVVGRVYPQLKVIVIHDEEIVAALSYKSNRNWTLPALSATLTNANTGTGLLAQNETMYLTYALENNTGTGLTNTLSCQKYAKITNQTALAKDVEFRLEGTDLLPYMRKIEEVGYDGRGFYGYDFKVLYQIVSDAETRPDPTAWKVYDFTTSGLTGGVTGETIDPFMLQNQIPSVNDFVLTQAKDSGATTYDITVSLGMAPVLSPEILQFGDERFFYGNLETFIGATIFKTIFDIRINAGQFIGTTNPTRSTDPSTNPPNIRVSEVGIYDSDNDLVVIGKLSKPIELVAGNTVMIEISMDF